MVPEVGELHTLFSSYYNFHGETGINDEFSDPENQHDIHVSPTFMFLYMLPLLLGCHSFTFSVKLTSTKSSTTLKTC